MNKKVSTLFTASLLFSSVFGSSVLAENLKIGNMATKLEAGKYYHLVMDKDDSNSNNNDYAFGFKKYSAQNKKITPCYATAGKDLESDVADPTAYLWEVKETSLKSVTGKNEWGYTLTNVKTKQVLRFDASGNALMTTDTNDAAYKASTDMVSWGREFWQYNTEVNSGTNDNTKFNNDRYLFVTALLTADNANANPLYINSNSKDWLLETNTSKKWTFNLYEAADESVLDKDLNDLYNSAGFNFSLGDSYADVINVFDVEGTKVRAIRVEKDAVEVDGSTQTFPKGTYFIVDGPTEAYDDANMSNEEKAAYLMACEFIAVSPSTNVSQDANKQKAGEGFSLTTVSGRDLNYYTEEDLDEIAENQDKVAKGDKISVWNACFDVKKNASNSGKYAVALQKYFLYNETATSATQTYGAAGTFDLQIADYNYGSGDFLVTKAKGTSYAYIFTFVESNAVAGTEFLYEDKAAIYNIKFVSGDKDDDESEYGKYLSGVAYNSNLYAKGSALIDKDMPEFQFVITAVNGTEVTFANRANDAVKFTAQLHEESDGYSLAIEEGTDPTFNILDIQTNGDIKNVDDDATLHLKHIVLETPASTDKFNGTWNEADESKVTISFARDNAPTSNKVYPTVKYNAATTGTSASFSLDAMTSEVAEAAQWQLNKSEKPKYITRTYAYRVGEGDKAVLQYKAQGDTVAYYQYTMQLVQDGALIKDEFLKSNEPTRGTNTYSLVSESSATPFVIKDNVDGSVSIIANTYDHKKHMAISDYELVKNDLSDYLGHVMEPVSMKQPTMGTNDDVLAKWVKTYLLPEAPEVSYPGEEGHVTIQSEKSDYVSMDDNRDAIVINNEEGDKFYLYVTDKDAVVPTFYIARGIGEGNNMMFLFNPEDSIDYYVADGTYNRTYQWASDFKKALFKAGTLDASRDTMTTSIKGAAAQIAETADNEGTQGGLNRFKFQIIETEDGDGYYNIRQLYANDKEIAADYVDSKNYLISYNEGLSWGKKDAAMKFYIEGVEAPTANEGVAASEIKVVAYDGAINIKNAAGKNVVVSTILGQIVANEVLTSDNATISVPAGIAIVSVDGEEAVKVSVK